MRCNYSDKKALKAVFQRSFSLGVGSVLSLRGRRISMQQLQRFPTGPRLDAEAIRGDWARVGRQLMWAAKSYKK